MIPHDCRRRPRATRSVVLLLSLALLAGCGGSPPLAPGEAPAAAADPVDAWLRRAEALRGLAFLRPVAVRALAHADVAAVVRDEIRALLSPGEIEAYRDAYAALGVLPPGADLVALFAQIYGEQMVGRYSPREGALYLIDRQSQGGYARETVAVHELVHALQHQHFPRTLELAERLRHNDDVVSSLSGALEGDASFTMLGADDGDAESERDLRSAGLFRDGMLAELEAPSEGLARAPLALRLSVIAPYAHGVMLAARRYGAGGNSALDALIEDAPLSTSELLAEGLDPDVAETAFVRLPLEELARALAPEGCTLGHHNVAGSLSLLALFEDQGRARAQAQELARGWRGDRFLRVDCPGRVELLWLTDWRSDAAAARFEAAYGSIAGALARNAPLAGAPVPRRVGSRVLVVTPGLTRLAALVLAGAEVRSYAGLSSWIAEDCFGEGSGCPLGSAERPRSSAGFPLQTHGALGCSGELDR